MQLALMQDLRFALRQLRKSPGFTATAMLTLALGIGANASIFTLVNAVMMKNLPVVDPQTLVRLGDASDCCVNRGTRDNGDYSLFSTETWRVLRKNVPEFADLAAMQAGFAYRPIIMRREGDQAGARSVMGEFVSGNYFRTFGLPAHAGRIFNDADDVAGAPATAVMSYVTWKNDYAADPSVIGATFYVNTKPVTVVGIAPAGFYGDRMSSTPPDLYLPIESMPVVAKAPYVHDADTQWLYMIGRLKPGVSVPALQQKISALVKNAFAQTQTFSSGEGKTQLARVHVVLTPGGDGIQDLREEYASNLRLLMIISGLVLVIGCANIANLLLARGMARKSEISLRTALGAGRGRIIKQLLTESVLLAGLSGLAGVIVAYAGTHMLLAMAFASAERLPIQASPSAAMLAFACGLSLLTGVLCGIAPAWIAARTEPSDALRTGMRSSGSGTSLLQNGLVMLQAAMSLVLLAGAGLFTESLNKMEHANLRLDSRNRYIVHINPQAAGYGPTQLDALYRSIEQRFHELPGIRKVGIALYTPMEDNNWSTGIQVQGEPRQDGGASIVKVNADYFDAVGTRVLMGRGISEKDTPGGNSVAVVNQEFVKKMFHGQNPIGRHFGTSRESAGDFEVVGVVEDTAYTSVRWKDHRMYFRAMLQRPPSAKDPIENDESLYAGALVLAADRPINQMEAIARRTLASINPNLTVVKFQTFDQQIAERFTEERLVARLSTMFAGLALLLAAVGLYGVTSYAVARRTSEIGIRMALGADRAGVIAMVMRGAALKTAIGLAIGIPAALLCVRFVRAQLFEVQGMDYGVLALATLTLLGAAAIAGMIPARRAASTDPVRALRTE